MCVAGAMSNRCRVPVVKIEHQPQPPLAVVARLLNVLHHQVSMPVCRAVPVLCQTGPHAVPAPVMAATTQDPAMKLMGCVMVRKRPWTTR